VYKILLAKQHYWLKVKKKEETGKTWQLLDKQLQVFAYTE